MSCIYRLGLVHHLWSYSSQKQRLLALYFLCFVAAQGVGGLHAGNVLRLPSKHGPDHLPHLSVVVHRVCISEQAPLALEGGCKPGGSAVHLPLALPAIV